MAEKAHPILAPEENNPSDSASSDAARGGEGMRLSSRALFAESGGAMGRRIREYDWSRHPLGPVGTWPQSLRTVVQTMLNSRFAMWIGWGSEVFFFYNDAYAPTLGEKESRALGTPASELWAEIWPDLAARVESVVTEGKATWDESLLLFLERSGYPEETYHTFSYSPIPDDSGAIGGMLCVVSEDTERVIAERRLEMLRDLASGNAALNTERELFETVHDCLSKHAKDLPFALIYHFDADGTRADISCAHGVAPGTALSPASLRLDDPRACWPAKEIRDGGGTMVIDDLHSRFDSVPCGPWSAPARAAAIIPIAHQDQAAPSGFLVVGINPFRPYDRKYRDFLDHVARQISTITEQRKAEAERNQLLLSEKDARQAAQHTAQRLGLALAAADLGDWNWDATSDVIILSARAAEIFGIDPDSPWTREAMRDLIHEDDRDGARQAAIRAAENGGDYDVEYRIIRNSSDLRWIAANGRCVFSPNGSVSGMLGVVQDITDRKQVEAVLKEAKETAEAASLAKDRFLAVLSHELRTPLTPVLLAVAALEMDPELGPAVREDLGMIRRNVELETKLIDDLLDLSRVTSGKLHLRMEVVDINEAVKQVCAICRAQVLEKGIHLHCDLGPDAGTVKADPARLQQVLWNVLKNAAKFTGKEGDIYVRTSCTASGWVRVEVRDTGMGIAADILPLVFDAFEQGDTRVTRQFGGLGLGLAISKALVEMLGGAIHAASDGPGKGSTFMIELPAIEASAESKPEAARIGGSSAGVPHRLLLVEDHPDTAFMLSRILRGSGYSVKVANTMTAALELASSETFDALISDLGLPDGTGYELMEKVRMTGLNMGIAMSGYGMDEDVRKSREAGFSEHLVKPVEVTQLQQAIIRLLTAGPS